MAATTEEVPVGRTGGSPGPGVPWRVKLRDDSRLAAILFLLPAVLILVGLLGYPLVLGVWLSLTDETLAESGHFVGLSNYAFLVRDPRFGTRRGYARCGGLFTGLWSDEVAVEWDG